MYTFLTAASWMASLIVPTLMGAGVVALFRCRASTLGKVGTTLVAGFLTSFVMTFGAFASGQYVEQEAYLLPYLAITFGLAAVAAWFTDRNLPNPAKDAFRAFE